MYVCLAFAKMQIILNSFAVYYGTATLAMPHGHQRIFKVVFKM